VWIVGLYLYFESSFASALTGDLLAAGLLSISLVSFFFAVVDFVAVFDFVFLFAVVDFVAVFDFVFLFVLFNVAADDGMLLLPLDTARARIFTRRGGCCWSEEVVADDCLACNGPNGELLKRCCWTGHRWCGIRRE